MLPGMGPQWTEVVQAVSAAVGVVGIGGAAPRAADRLKLFDESHFECRSREVAGSPEQAEDLGDVGLGLWVGGDAAAGLDWRGTGVVAGEGERDRSELAEEVVHEVGLGVDRGGWVERVAQAVAGGGAGHELCDSLSARG
jgi:hypothetical protein